MFNLRILIFILTGQLVAVLSFAQNQHIIDSLLSKLEIVQHDTLKVFIYTELSKEYGSSDLDSAFYYANEGLLLSKELTYQPGLAESYACLGDIEVQKDNLDAAREHYLKSIDYFKNSNRKEDIALVNIVLGNIYLVQDNYFMALQHYHDGVAIAEEYNFKEPLEYLYSNLGLAYNRIENYEKALEFLQKALDVSKEADHKDNIASIFINIGSIYYSQSDFQLAKTYYEKARTIAVEIDDKAIQSNSIVALGEIYEREKKYDVALSYFEESLAIAQLIDDEYRGPKSFLFARSYSNIGNVYFIQERFPEAIDYLERGYTLAQETGQLNIVAQIAENLSYCYEALNEYKTSLKYARIFKINSDSVENEDIVKKITKLEMQFEFDKQLKEKELEQTKKEAVQKRKELVYLMIIGGSVLSLIIFSLLYILQKNKIKRVQLNEEKLRLEKENLTKELDFKNKELTTNVMYLLKKNELIVNITEKLKKAKNSFKPENRKIADDVIRELEMSSTTDTWKEFELRFQEVHSDFYDKLNKGFPDLSPNELKLCAFLRLNMSTKEIAALTYLSVNSINIARHRLRKKLNIEHDENLITYLSQL